MLRLFAPFLPFVTEEVWSWWQDGSVHDAAMAAADEIESCSSINAGTADGNRDQAAYDWATDVLFEVRKQRSEAKQPLKVPITKVTITAEPGALARMPHVEADLRSALRVQAFETDSLGKPREIVVGIRAGRVTTRPSAPLSATSSSARSTKILARPATSRPTRRCQPMLAPVAYSSSRPTACSQGSTSPSRRQATKPVADRDRARRDGVGVCAGERLAT